MSAKAPRLAAGRARALGVPTRGTTAPQRLRRVDRWVTGTQAAVLRDAVDPLVLDLGYGATPVTTVELADRLAAVRPDVEVVGVEIDPERVAAAQASARPGLSFLRGGYELPSPRGRRPVLVRAMNVLRQYPEEAVGPSWAAMLARLADGGLLVEGTCDESGRLASWVALGVEGPRSLTLAAHLATLDRPATLAERLPKVLIHRNVPGEGVHALVADLDRAWTLAPSVHGARQRWSSACAEVAQRWPLLGGPRRWRLGELTVEWHAVAPHD